MISKVAKLPSKTSLKRLNISLLRHFIQVRLFHQHTKAISSAYDKHMNRRCFISWWRRRNSPEDFFCVQQAEATATTRNICEGESFYFHFIQRLVYFFSGWKFSSSSLLKILLGFQLKLFLFSLFCVTGIVFLQKCFECFCLCVFDVAFD